MAVVCELDFDRAVVEKLGVSFALDLVACVAPAPLEWRSLFRLRLRTTLL